MVLHLSYQTGTFSIVEPCVSLFISNLDCWMKLHLNCQTYRLIIVFLWRLNKLIQADNNGFICDSSIQTWAATYFKRYSACELLLRYKISNFKKKKIDYCSYHQSREQVGLCGWSQSGVVKFLNLTLGVVLVDYFKTLILEYNSNSQNSSSFWYLYIFLKVSILFSSMQSFAKSQVNPNDQVLSLFCSEKQTELAVLARVRPTLC